MKNRNQTEKKNAVNQPKDTRWWNKIHFINMYLVYENSFIQ